MLTRHLDSYISNYYRTSRNALLLTGARQTGKTFAIRKFGESFKNFVEINFIDQPDAVKLFDMATSAEDIMLRLSLFASKPLTPGDTLIFFDEIQMCPAIVTALKFLVDEGSYRYILSGSLLGVELKDIKSVPVGYMGIKEVFPLSFQEFIENIGISNEIISKLKECMTAEQEVDEFIHAKIMELFRLYLIVGGMPAPVWDYVSTNDLARVIQTQKDIVSLYRKDIAQYATHENRLKIKEIFDLIPSELNSKNKRFILKRLNEHAKFNRYEDSFVWLAEAGMAIPVYNVEEPKIPLKLAETRNLFKLFSNDVGLLAAQYADGIQRKILAGDTTINYGSIYENVVAQELLHNGFDPYYFNNKKQGEIDFVVAKDSGVLPIEVKSGKDYLRHNALNNVLTSPKYDIHKAIVLCNGNVKREGEILYLPIYMLMFIEPDKTTPGVYKVNLEGLF